MPLPPDLRVALSPLATYRELTTAPADDSNWLRALERPVLVAVIVGTAVTLASAERVPFAVVAVGILSWSFVPALQLMVGAVVSGIAPARSITMARAIELLFMAQLPWSLWVLAMTGLNAFTSVPQPLAVQVSGLLVPGIWTAFIVSAFCQTALGCSKRRARWLTAFHQTTIWVLFFAFVFLVSGFWSRILAAVGA
jgi:hypothetical protein